LNNFDKLKTRIIVAQSVGISPDQVRIIDEGKRHQKTLYAIDDFKGHNLVMAFDEIPTKDEAREKVKELYLTGIEWDFDDEMGSI